MNREQPPLNVERALSDYRSSRVRAAVIAALAMSTPGASYAAELAMQGEEFRRASAVPRYEGASAELRARCDAQREARVARRGTADRGVDPRGEGEGQGGRTAGETSVTGRQKCEARCDVCPRPGHFHGLECWVFQELEPEEAP